MTRQRILITGASSGLGAAMAREFARLGRDLALCARRLEPLQALQTELQAAHGVKVVVATLDVDEHDSVAPTFEQLARALGGLDRLIVNAGIGVGRRIGTGHWALNKQTAITNYVSALVQCEAAVAYFRAQQHGHLVTVSSLSAKRGLGGHITNYAASKAALAALSEGIRADLMNTPIRVTTLFPGFIRTPLNEGLTHMPFAVDVTTGARALVRAIEREPAHASVPTWPWAPLGFLMQHLPLSWVSRLI